MDDREQRFQERLRREREVEGNVHPDGCYYCGGEHPTDCCPDQAAIDEHWEC